MRCPKCGGGSHVKQTLMKVYRKRQCNDCGFRFDTKENIAKIEYRYSVDENLTPQSEPAAEQYSQEERDGTTKNASTDESGGDLRKVS